MKEIKKIDPVSFSQVLGLIHFVAGFIFGVVIIAIDYWLGMGQLAAIYGAWVAILPVVYAVIFSLLSFLIGLIFAILYNFFAKRVGGIKIELK